MEERQEIKTYRIRFKCPNCVIGYLNATGRIVNTSPLTYLHRCDVCGYEETFNKKYPRQISEPNKSIEFK
jgi:predicted RNA-binding Zn-ribbon protein involved in translation (DUF1610 family)